MVEDVPEGFTVAFSQLKKMHDELYANMTLQTTIVEGLILKAHQNELAIARQTLQVEMSNCSKALKPAIAEAPDSLPAIAEAPEDFSDVADERKEDDCDVFKDVSILQGQKSTCNGLTDDAIMLEPEEKPSGFTCPMAVRERGMMSPDASFTQHMFSNKSATGGTESIGFDRVASHASDATNLSIFPSANISASSANLRSYKNSLRCGTCLRRSVDSSVGMQSAEALAWSRSPASNQVSRLFASYASNGSCKSVTFGKTPAISTVCSRWETLVQKVILHWLSGRKMSVLHLKPQWAKELAFDWSMLANRIDAAASRTDSLRTDVAAGSVITGHSFLQRFVIHPDSMLSKLILILGGIALVYDIVTVPFMLSFDIAAQGVLFVLNWSLTVFWTLDMLASSLTGYYAKILIEMRPSLCIMHYFKTWGVLDLVINLSDWISLAISFVDSDAGGANHVLSASRVLKYYRFLRVLRMFRLFKLLKAMGSYIDGFATEMMLVFLKLISIVLVIFLLNHYIACCWCALAMTNSTDDNTWLRQLHMEGSSNEYMYVVAIHWAMTQFTPATNNVNPMNLRERVFAFFVVFFALIMFSSFLSGLASALAQIKKIQVERYEEEAKIRRFIFERQVSLNCARRIWSFYRTFYKSAPATMCYNDVAFLTKLPRPIRLTLHQDVSLPILAKHPLFEHIGMLDTAALLVVCDKGLTECAYQTQQEVFHIGDKADFVYFLNSGTVGYECDTEGLPEQFPAPQVFSEAALWSPWLHRGTLTTHNKCHILQLDANNFGKNMEVHAQGATLCCMKSYAKGFVDLANVGVDDTSITDVAHKAAIVMIQQTALNAFAPYVRHSTLSSLPSSIVYAASTNPIVKGMVNLKNYAMRNRRNSLSSLVGNAGL